MANFKQIVHYLIASCMVITIMPILLVSNAEAASASSLDSTASLSISPGKYHHRYDSPEAIATTTNNQKTFKKSYGVAAKGLNMMSAISSRQNPIKNWLGAFNRNHTGPQVTGGFGSPSGSGHIANDAVQQHTCSCRCGERNDESRIVGGTTTGVSEYPWMARLSYFNRFYCGGTLINDRYVLTAAHCVKGFMWFMIKVTFGEHDRCNDKERPETRFVLRAFTQKFSFSNFDNDIALLRLNDRVPITSFIRPICLPRPEERNDLFVGTKGIATGWGTLKEDGKPSCLLQEVEVPVLENDVCVAQTNYTQKMITKNMMCAGYPGTGVRDSCQGDSGGPLVRLRPDDKRYEQIGIVSWGNGCARPDYPGVYTRVTKYLDWITENSRDGCFCDEEY
ncbi:venom protease [Haematobia irritans]|uniref:venom protease n=1 Tax=Haematobia irritans TaxID=7368 RepID=UPI003F4F95FB